MDEINTYRALNDAIGTLYRKYVTYNRMYGSLTLVGDFTQHWQETVNEEKIGINDRLKASAWKELGKLPFDFELSMIKTAKNCYNIF